MLDTWMLDNAAQQEVFKRAMCFVLYISDTSTRDEGRQTMQELFTAPIDLAIDTMQEAVEITSFSRSGNVMSFWYQRGSILDCKAVAVLISALISSRLPVPRAR
jgi:hypothetical protein